jgi:translation initiation factor 2 alpha subunit (eIF-2alpha)
MRYYEQKYPEVDELVMVQVRQIAEMGAYVKLVSFQSGNYRASSHCNAHFSWNTTTRKE